MSGKKADAKMPYGYGKWEAMGTLMVGVMLLAAAASLIVHLVEHLREVLAGNVQYVEIAAMFVAVVSTIVKEVAFQATFRVGTKINSQVRAPSAPPPPPTARRERAVDRCLQWGHSGRAGDGCTR
jgi:cation diffusion facilitator family transporter